MSTPLRTALLAHLHAAGELLAAAVAEGAEVPFEIVEGGRRTAPLYCYHPLTDAFVHERGEDLRRLPTWGPAVGALAGRGGLDAYVQKRGGRVRRGGAPTEIAAIALEAFLVAAFGETGSFEPDAEREQRAVDELERSLDGGAAQDVLAVAVHGLAIGSERILLADGLELARAEALTDVPPEPGPPGEHALVFVLLPLDADSPERAARRLRRLGTALRLYGNGAIHLGGLGWLRGGTGPWRPVPLSGFPVSSAGPPAYLVASEQEDELRAFVSLVARRTPKAGELAWALARWEAGCAQPVPAQALTDHLLAARVLLGPDDRVADRLAAICALPDERAALVRVMEHALAVEASLTHGVAATADVGTLVAQLAEHLGALMRDVVCGHLDSDLRAVADALLDPLPDELESPAF